MDESPSVLETEGLVCGYDRPLLGPLNLAVSGGEFVLIEGPNGIGKSALLLTLAGLEKPLEGSLQWGVGAAKRRFVPQVPSLDATLPATVSDVVATGAQQGGGLQALRSSATDAEIRQALSRVEMEEQKGALFRELSEGQKQLVLLARTLIGEAEVLLLDEPTASMDPDRERRAVEMLETEQVERGATVFIIAHGSQSARRAATSVLSIDRDRDVTFGEVTDDETD